MSAIFISYSHRNRERVADIVAGLKRSKVAVWWDEDLPPGRTWDDQIERALEEASAVLIVWSRDAVASENVKDEAYYAREENKALPVRIEDVKMPLRFRRIQFLDLLRSPAEENEDWTDLVAAVSDRFGRVTDPTDEPTEVETSRSKRPDGVAISWRMVLPAALVALGIVTNVVGTIAFGGESQAVMAASWSLSGAGLAFAISNLMPRRG